MNNFDRMQALNSKLADVCASRLIKVDEGKMTPLEAYTANKKDVSTYVKTCVEMGIPSSEVSQTLDTFAMFTTKP